MSEDDRTATVVGSFKKSAKEILQVSLTTYKTYRYIDVRSFVAGLEGELVPTRKGITVKPEDLPELIKLLQEARDAAQAAGWSATL